MKRRRPTEVLDKLCYMILVVAVLVLQLPLSAIAQDAVVSDADSVWSQDLIKASSDVIDSTDAPSQNLNEFAVVSHGDCVWSQDLIKASSDVIDSMDAPSQNLIEYAVVSHGDCVWSQDSIAPTFNEPPSLVDPDQSTVTVDPTSVPADGTSTATITVTLRDNSGALITDGRAVEVSTNRPEDAISPAPGYEDGTSDGDGVFKCKIASTVGGEATITAVADGVELSQHPVVSFAQDPALVGYWKLDEGSGAIAFDSARENDGTLVNSPTWTTGRIDGGLEFDGNNDYVEIPDSSDLDIEGPLTLAAWIKPDAMGGRYFDIVEKRDYATGLGAADANYELWIKPLDGCLRFTIGNVNNFSQVVATTPVAIGSWSHVAAVYDGSSLSIYMNGDLIVSGTGIYDRYENLIDPDDVIVPKGNDANLTIGALKNRGEYFDGTIDDVRIYDRALSVSEIHELALQDLPPTCNTVDIPDPNLEEAIREAIGKPSGDICQSDLDGLTELEASDRGISDLSGLEHCTNLESLRLDSNHGLADLSPLAALSKLEELRLRNCELDNIEPLSNLVNLRRLYLFANQIADLSPLGGLVNIKYLGLELNQIRDISPLCENEGLQEQDYINLYRNPLGYDAFSVHIPALEARGVIVFYGLPPDRDSLISAVESLRDKVLDKMLDDYYKAVEVNAIAGTNLWAELDWYTWIATIEAAADMINLANGAIEDPIEALCMLGLKKEAAAAIQSFIKDYPEKQALDLLALGIWSDIDVAPVKLDEEDVVREIFIADIDGVDGNELILHTYGLDGDLFNPNLFDQDHVELYRYSDGWFVEEEGAQFYEPYGMRHMCVADVDNDGKNEIVVHTKNGWDPHRIHVLEYNGETFEYDKDIPKLDEGGEIRHMAVADVDNDERNELVLHTYGGWRGGHWVVIYEYDNAGKTWVKDEQALLKESEIQHMVVADVDNDGSNELVLHTYSFGKGHWVVLYNYSSSKHGFIKDEQALLKESEIRHMIVADADNDGSNELVLHTFGLLSDHWVVLYNYNLSTSKLVKDEQALLNESDILQMVVADVDTDGKNELVLQTVGILSIDHWIVPYRYSSSEKKFIKDPDDPNEYYGVFHPNEGTVDCIAVGDATNSGFNNLVYGFQWTSLKTGLVCRHYEKDSDAWMTYLRDQFENAFSGLEVQGGHHDDLGESSFLFADAVQHLIQDEFQSFVAAFPDPLPSNYPMTEVMDYIGLLHRAIDTSMEKEARIPVFVGNEACKFLPSGDMAQLLYAASSTAEKLKGTREGHRAFAMISSPMKGGAALTKLAVAVLIGTGLVGAFFVDLTLWALSVGTSAILDIQELAMEELLAFYAADAVLRLPVDMAITKTAFDNCLNDYILGAIENPERYVHSGDVTIDGDWVPYYDCPNEGLDCIDLSVGIKNHSDADVKASIYAEVYGPPTGDSGARSVVAISSTDGFVTIPAGVKQRESIRCEVFPPESWDNWTDYQVAVWASIGPEVVMCDEALCCDRTSCYPCESVLTEWIAEGQWAEVRHETLVDHYNIVYSLFYNNSDMDLHVYDSLNHHVGMNYETGAVDLEIPGAAYSGPDCNLEWISVPEPDGETYTVKVYGKQLDEPEDFFVTAYHTPRYEPMLAVRPSTLELTCPVGGSERASFNIGEYGCQVGISGFSVT